MSNSFMQFCIQLGKWGETNIANTPEYNMKTFKAPFDLHGGLTTLWESSPAEQSRRHEDIRKTEVDQLERKKATLNYVQAAEGTISL